MKILKRSAPSFSPSRVRETLTRLKFKNGLFTFDHDEYNAFMSMNITVPDNITKGNMAEVASRCMLLSDHPEEVIQTAWGLVNSWSRHELGEQFYVDGKLPYNEHNKY